ncbi:unnamed protein product [Effrenium voratum]|uniref:J domain-containing protein n=1 Tax=Effrenium voratum TaxID=2562239 RepID=A0AA36J4H6_9DINO|nr:unnamed protein product [Effrenium voratum]
MSIRFGFCFPAATGHLNPSLPIARKLLELGHEVHYLSRPEMRAKIEQTGASFSDTTEEMPELFAGRETDIMGAMRALGTELGIVDAPMMVGMLSLGPIHLELQMPGAIRWMQRVKPQLVLFCPFMNPEAVYAARYLQIPAVGLWTFAGPGSMIGMTDMFLMQTGLEPAVILEEVEAFQPTLDCRRRLEEKYGIEPDVRAMLNPQGFMPTMCLTRYNLVTTGADFQDPVTPELTAAYDDAGATFVPVGPLLDETPPQRVEGPVDPVQAVKDARSAGRQVILVSMGTILVSDTSTVGWHEVPKDGTENPKGVTGKQLCQAAWSAAFDAFGVQGAVDQAPLLVVAIGSQPDALENLTVPSNALCLPHLPQVELLRAGVDLFLTHGGQNSFMESLMAGVPVVVCPGFADQIANAMRADAMQVGLQIQRPLPEHGQEPEALKAYQGQVTACLRRVLAEESFRDRAQYFGNRLQQEGGVARSVEMLLATAREGLPRLLGSRVELAKPDAAEKPAFKMHAELSRKKELLELLQDWLSIEMLEGKGIPVKQLGPEVALAVFMEVERYESMPRSLLLAEYEMLGMPSEPKLDDKELQRRLKQALVWSQLEVEELQEECQARDIPLAHASQEEKRQLLLDKLILSLGVDGWEKQGIPVGRLTSIEAAIMIVEELARLEEEKEEKVKDAYKLLGLPHEVLDKAAMISRLKHYLVWQELRPSELRKECIKHNILASGDLEDLVTMLVLKSWGVLPEESATDRNRFQPPPRRPAPAPPPPASTKVASAFQVLGLEVTAPQDQVRKAYRRLALQHHPDKNPGLQQEQAAKKFQQITSAYDIAMGHLKLVAAHR